VPLEWKVPSADVDQKMGQIWEKCVCCSVSV
jgi:hypothetical protein